MRNRRRNRLLLAGKVTLAAVLALTAIAAIASGRPGWTNYWGGFVYAPFALVVAALFALAIVKRRDVGETRSRRGPSGR